MKKSIIFLFTLCSMLLISSCGKDETSDGTSFTCKIDGVNFETSGLLAYGIKDADNLLFYGVKGEIGSQQSIIIWVPANAKKGDEFTDKTKFRIDYTDAGQVHYSTQFSDKASGKVTISNVASTTASGTFEATLLESENGVVKKTISGGSFDIVYR